MLLTLLIVALSVLPISFVEATPREGYNSQDGAIEKRSFSRKIRFYTLYQIEQLERSFSPRYVRIMRFRKKGAKSKPAQKGILFTYEGYRNKNVAVAGDFNNWSPLPMRRNQRGIFYYILTPRKDEQGQKIDRYAYKYLADGIWKRDPQNKSYQYDETGALFSLFYLDNYDIDRQVHAAIVSQGRGKGEKLVEFSIYLPKARNVSLVGNFNNWNPDHDLMTGDKDGLFRYRLYLSSGEYSYMYIADGRWILDKYNQETRYNPLLDGLSSFLKIP